MDLEALKTAIYSGEFRITNHALLELKEDKLILKDIINSLHDSQIIEDYMTSKPLPSCLLLNFIKEKEAIHTVWAFNSALSKAVLITAYRPHPEKWVEYKWRKI